MKAEKAIKLVFDEIKRAEEIHPCWPKDIVHGAAILAEEAGSAIKAALDAYYGRDSFKNLEKEIIHATAMGFRFLLNFMDNIEAEERAREKK